MKHIFINETSWHFKLYHLTYKINGKEPVWLDLVDVYVLRVMFFWAIIGYCAPKNWLKKKWRAIKQARFRSMPRVEFVPVDDANSKSIRKYFYGER